MFGWWKTRQLHKAASCGDVSTIQSLLQNGADPNARREYGSFDILTPLHAAILHGSLAATKTLLDNGADIAATCSRYSWSALHLAVKVANNDIIHHLCDCGLSVDVRASDGKTPLHYCAQMACNLSFSPDHAKYLQTISALLTLGVDVNARDNRGQTPLFYAAATNGCAEAITMLLDAGADINALDDTGQNVLFWADGKGVVELLLQRGVDHSIRDKRGWTALKCAQFAGIHVRKVELLENLEM